MIDYRSFTFYYPMIVLAFFFHKVDKSETLLQNVKLKCTKSKKEERDLKSVYFALSSNVMSYFKMYNVVVLNICELRLTNIVQDTFVQLKCVFAQY